MESERTPLRSGAPAPNYVFMTNPNRVYRTKIRQFQCCVCAAILTVFVAAVVMTVSYSVNHDTDDDNGTTPSVLPPEQLMILLKQPWPLKGSPTPTDPVWSHPAISPGELEAAIEAGQEGLRARDELESISPSLDLLSPSYRHTKAVSTSPQATELARSAFVMDVATKQLVAGRRKTTGGSVGCGPKLDADWLPEEVCRDTLDEFSSCPPTPYRSVDGSCNNLQHPLKWGVGMRPFRRTMPADYADGVSEPRTASDGSPLPSAREVSVTVHRPLYHDDPDFTVMLAVWGQFIDHDITATALSQKSNGKTISCCRDGQWAETKYHPECFPVRLTVGDPYYHAYNLTCMEFVRSAPAPTCSLGAREQLNQASNFLDGSVIYGTTPELMSSLRRYINGELRMMVTEDGRTLLPKSEDPNDGCNRAEMNAKGRYCFLSGDSRANENTHLTSMHLLWARQHNALAVRLAKVNPTWDDERLFQETRRIVGAQMEHITYNEFLPIIFGQTLMDKLELTPKKTGYYEGYDETVDPTIANSFAASAFRFAHTLLPGLMKVLANATNTPEYVEMHKILFNPYVLYQPGYLDGTLKGLMDTDILKVDPHVSSELTQHLFESSPFKVAKATPCGLDLVSLNIQRGRDHGLPSYPNWREHCGLSRPTSFDDLKGIMDDDSIGRISTIYKSVEDIDVYTGMLSEIPLEGGIIGPTVTCVLADQFVRLKKGDRYWYETSLQPQAFTPEQLDEIRKTTLAKVLCDTSDSVSELQRQVMRSVTPTNPRVSCSELPEPDLSKWREVEGSYVQAGIGRVKVPSSNIHIAPPTSAGRLTAAAGPGKPFLKTLAVGATVMGGRIFTAGGTAWSGQLPLAIPVPLFDTVDYSRKIDINTTDPPVIGHGILWEGTLSTDSYGYANFEGRFSVPRYIHGKGIQRFAMKWLSGEFSFYTKLAWDSTHNVPITVSGKYSSPVYLQDRAQYHYLKDPKTAPALHSFYDVSSGFVPNPTVQNGPGVYKSPCILHGTYSTDKKTFLWTGNVTLIVPNAVPYDTWANYWSQTNEIGVFKRSSWLTSSKPGVSAATTKSSIAVGVTVTSGSVTASSNGSSPVTWWSGNFPVAIPVPIFNRVLTSSTGSGSVVFGTGVSWSGSSTATGPLSSNVTGSFSLPIYVRGPGANLSIEWWEGNFSMQTQSLWNVSLNGAFSPGVTYTSPIYLRAPKTYGALQTVLDTLDDIDGDPTLQLLTASGGSAGTATKVPIILHGNYTPDKTQFYWMGNITFILPTAPSPSSYTFTLKSKYKSWVSSSSIPESGVTPTKPLSLGMTVQGGRISTAAGNMWSGEIPVAIPVPLFDSVVIPDPAGLEGTDPPVYGHGIVWTGGISSDSSGYANMEGTFSMPKYVHGKGIPDFDIQWLSGDFVFYTRLIWNSTGIVPTSITGKYSSPVYLRATKQYEYLRDLMPASASGTMSNLNAGFVSKTAVVNDPSIKKAPIILHGTYSIDKTMFIWSGNATLVIPDTVPSFSLLSSKKSSIIKPPANKSTFSIAVGARVTSGSITASSGGSSPVTWWSGAIPATLPVPLFNKVVSASAGSGAIVFGTGVSWSGSVVSNGAAGSVLSGTFSLPTYTHGPGTNLSIEWWTGTFSLQYNNLWNATLEGAILPGVTYTSPIYFRQAKSADSLDVMMKDYVDAEKINNELEVNLLTAGAGGTGLKMPIILHGNYTPDKTQFYWFGNVTFILPLMPPSSPIAQEQLIVKTASYKLSPVTSVGTPLVLGGTVVSGSISSTTGSVWSGELPVVIPLPLFDSVTTAGAVDMDQAAPPAFGHGILWDGTVSTDYSGMANIVGTYSMPKFVHGSGLANFSIQWLNGNFMFNSRLTWNSSLSMPISLSGKYSSSVYLRAIKEFEYLKYTTPSSMSSSFYETSGSFISSPSVVNDPAVLKAPLILLGAYSIDKTSFIWSGNYSMIIPNAIPALSQSEKLGSPWMASATEPGVVPKPTKSSMAVGVSVTSGSITASSGGSSPVTWWSGAFPATLPVPLFNKVVSASAGSGAIVFGSGISWSGSVVSNGAAGSVLSGTFSLPIYTRGPGTILSIEWWTGTFSLQYNNLWNATLEGAVLPGVTYTSPIYFRQAKSVDSLDVMMKDYIDAEKINNELEANLLTAGAGGTGLKMPIILHGNYTPDKTQFYWFGNATVILPLMPPPSPIAQEQLIVKTASYKLSPVTSVGTPLVLGGTVVSGSISSTTGSVWSGELPVVIPLPLFDSVTTAGAVDMDQAAPPAFGHGILWDGTVSTDYSGTANIVGTYSMPKFVHGSGLANFSIEWLNGNFMFNSRLTWNSSLSMPISLTGKYSSPVYLRAIKEFEYLKYTTPSSMSSSFYEASGTFTSSPSVVNDPALLKAPLILLGAYSIDKTSFIWSGNYSMIIPNAIPALSQSGKLGSPWMASATEPGVVPKPTKSSMAVGVSVTSGSITASSGGSSPVTWWSGAFPATLPVPLFNKVVSASAGSGAIVFGSGISWSGSVVSNGAAGSVLSGTFSLPIYTRGPGTILSIEWWTGTFSLQYNNLWNATLEGAILPGVTYTSPIYFRQAKSVDSLDVMMKDYIDAEKINNELEVNLLTAGAGGTGLKMPIILHGNYTPDKTQFYWFGNATVILPLMPPSSPIAQEQLIVKTASYKLSPGTSVGTPLILGGTVVSGSISSTTGSVWSGELPVVIPLPLFDSVATAGAVDMDQAAPPAFGHGILWDGTVSTDYSGTANIVGTYSMPKFVHGSGLANFSIQWLNGNFMFNSRLTWNSSLSMPISLTGKYSSPVYLRAIKEFEYLKYTTPSSMSSSFYETSGSFISSPSVVNDPAVLKAPLILLGAYSIDKTSFIWSGNYSMIIPNAIPALSQSEKLGSPWMASATVPGVVPKPTKSSMAVGVSVTSGSITASSGDSSPVTWWSGAFPATLPVPLFNKVVSASAGSGTIVFGSGISWSGSVVSNGAAGSVLSGTFSLPIYTRGPGTILSIEWWTGTFSLQYNNLWNATLEGAILPGVTYTSPIYFRQAKSADSLDVMMKDYVDAEKINNELEFNLLTAGAGGTGLKMPIILHGNYTPDKTQFYWFGNATVILPLMPPSSPVMASNVRLTSSPVNTFIPTKPIRKPLALGATVMGGQISTTGGSAWGGELPVAFPLPLFDSVAVPGEIDTETTDPPTYGHGILWEGTVSTDSYGYANFEGKFSMPNYIHGNGIANFTMKWLSGSFVFYTRLVWNSTVNVPVSVTGTYSSPVYLQERPEYEYLKDPKYASTNTFSDVSSGFTSQPSISNGPGVFRSPCILHGIYSDDRKTFLWSGNFTLIVPNAIPIDLWPGTLYLPQLTGKSKLQSQLSSGDLTNKTKTSVPIALNVTSGTVTASTEGSTPTTWWNGTLPAALPVPLFNKVVTASKAPGKVIFGTGVSWNVTVNTNNTAGVSMLNGTFSLPVYVRGPGALFSIQWWSGNFSLEVSTLLNNTLDAVLQPGITYSSPVYLRAAPMVDSLDTDVNKIDSISSNPTLQFITSAKGDMTAEPKAPIILYGTYSPDKTQFWWSGNATLSVPPPTPSPLKLIKLQKKMKSSVTSAKSSAGGKVTLGGVVTSGSVVASSDSSSPSMWWNGEFPVAIQSNSVDGTTNVMSAPPLFAQGVSWQGSLTKTAINEILLQGTFSMPRFIHGGGLKNFSIEWYRGQFSFQMSLLWNSMVDGLVSPGDTFSSSIYLQPIGMKNKSEPSFLNWDQPTPQIDSENLVHFISKSQEIISGATQVPVVLEGTYSSDFSIFWWTGNVIVSFPVPLTPQPSAVSFARIALKQASKAGKAGKPPKPAKPPKVSTTIGVSVVSGSIVAGLDGNDPTVWWDGQIPLSFPLPAKDLLTMGATAPALSQNITWNGTLVSDPTGGALWEGQFSLPSFNNSNGMYTYSTPLWTGRFSFKLSFLWSTSPDGLVKPGVTYTSHVRLINSAPKKMSTLVTDIKDSNDIQPEPCPSPITERPPEPTPDVGPSTEPPAPKSNTDVPIMLRGYLSPDQTTFHWMGSAIITFPIAT